MPENLEYIWTILSAILSLAGVLLLAYVTLRWMGRRMSSPLGGSRMIQVQDRVSIGQDKQLLVVTVGDKSMLIGVAGNSIQKLTDLEELPPRSDSQPSSDFSQVLKDTLSQGIDRLKQKGEQNDG